MTPMITATHSEARTWVFVLVLAAGSGSALAQGPGPITVPFSDFRLQSAATKECLWDPINGAVEATDNLAHCCLVAPVYLPDGERLKFFVLWFKDSTSSNFSLYLRRKELASSSPSEVVASISTNTTTPGIKVLIAGVTPALQQVDNLTYSYFLSTDDSCPVDSNHAIYSATVSFFD